MSIVESNRSKSGNAKVKALASLAVLSSAVFVAAPKAWGSAAQVSTGNVSWFNTANWASGTVTGFLPESGGSNTQGVINITANNASLPTTGVLFDPANQINNGNYIAKVETGPQNYGTFYIANSNTTSHEVSAPNALTINSGTLEAWAWTIGRDSSALLTQNGGTIVVDEKLAISASNTAAGDGSFVQGSGTYAYHGGSLIVKNQIQVAGGYNVNSTLTNQEVGKWVIYNDGPDGAIQVSNSIKFASNSLGTGTTGIVEFHYDLNTNGVGNVRPVQDNVNTTNAQLSLSNTTDTTSELNFVLDTIPSYSFMPEGSGSYNYNSEYVVTPTQNLGLFKENSITGSGTFPKIFYATDGVTGYSQGAVITATVGNIQFAWTISYSATIQFSNTANSAYTVTSAYGGNDIALFPESLIEQLPEPSSAALLGSVGSLILARRRRKV